MNIIKTICCILLASAAYVGLLILIPELIKIEMTL